jgi:hypothetical protein
MSCISQTLNQLAAQDRYSGVMMWPGGGFTYRGIVPKFHYAWNMSISWDTRVDLTIDWFVYVLLLTRLFSLVSWLYKLHIMLSDVCIC